jgi:hypothetical protein
MNMYTTILREASKGDDLVRTDDKPEELPDSELINNYIKKQIMKFFDELPTAEAVYLPSFLTPQGVKPIDLDEYFRQRTEGMMPMCVELTQKNYISEGTWADIKTWFEQQAIGKVLELKSRHLKVMKIDLYNDKMAIITFKIMKEYPAKDPSENPKTSEE